MSEATPTVPEPTEHSSDEAIDPCVAAGLPGAPHEKLQAFEGTWDAAVQFWMQPGADPVPSQGTMVNEWILGGRFLEQRYESDFMGSPFHGRGLFGYSQLDQRYEGFWVDTMSTGMLIESGSYDESTRTFTMLGQVTNPADGQVMRKKTIITVESETRHTMAMHFSEGEPEEFWKCMEIVYTKR